MEIKVKEAMSEDNWARIVGWGIIGIFGFFVVENLWSTFMDRGPTDTEFYQSWARNRTEQSLVETRKCLAGEPSEFETFDCREDWSAAARYQFFLSITEDEPPLIYN